MSRQQFLVVIIRYAIPRVFGETLSPQSIELIIFSAFYRSKKKSMRTFFKLKFN